MSRLHLQLVRSVAASTLADIEWTPHLLDKQRVIDEYNKTKEELERLGAELEQCAGGINLGSNVQLAEFIYGTLGVKELVKYGEPIRTGKGKPKTDQDTLKELKLTNNKQRNFFELYFTYNKLSDALSKYLETFKAIVEEHNCELYGYLQQCIAVTGRLTSAGEKVMVNGKPMAPQLQNLPREFKDLFTAPEGWSVGEMDGAQLEFRVAAELTGCPQATKDIREKVDVHANTAAAFVSAGAPKFTALEDKKAQRQLAKPQTFKPFLLAA